MLKNQGKVIKTEIEDQLKNRAERIAKLEEKVDILEGKFCPIDHLDKRLDDCEQYFRRTSLRINDIPLCKQDGKEDCIGKVDEIMQSLDCDLQRIENDWAYRIGSKRKYDKRVVSQQFIVKFKFFEART